MDRKIYAKMLEWKNSKEKKPLVILGPRQVGKTYSAKQFANSNFRHHVMFNFQESKELAKIFKKDLDPKRLIRELSAYSQESINENTLILFDEIQDCEDAVTSLKYFQEDLPEQPIIATGSMLGLITGPSNGDNSKRTYPVGKVKEIQMHPLDLEEFAWATGRKKLSDNIIEHFQNMSKMPLHDTALEMYREYLAIGGMPEAVKTYVETKDTDMVLSIQRDLNNGFIGDISKHAGSSDTVVKTLRTWNSMVTQLMKDNLKFQYNKISSGGRSSQYSASVDWLVAARLVNRCIRITEPSVPLSGYEDQCSFRLFIGDTGILSSKAEVPFKTVMSGKASDRFRGRMAENYIMQSLVSNGITPYYWNPDQNTEVDFVIQDSYGKIIPIEVKSGDRTDSKSLKKFRERYHPDSSIRISSKNFGMEDGLYSIPLYATFCIDREWSKKIGQNDN